MSTKMQRILNKLYLFYISSFNNHECNDKKNCTYQMKRLKVKKNIKNVAENDQEGKIV